MNPSRNAPVGAEIDPSDEERIAGREHLFGLGAVSEFHEREPARTTGFTIDRHHHVRRLGDRSEVGSEIRLAGAVRQIPDEQTDCQGSL